MKNRKTLSTIIVFFVGVVVGFGILYAIGVIVDYPDRGTQLTHNPKIFGDIKVYAYYQSDVGASSDPNIYRTLWMTKDGVPFLSIIQKASGEVSAFHLLNDKKEPVFSMEPLSGSGKWGRAAYRGYNQAGELSGDDYVDIDFDGHFDIKLHGNGKLASVSIFVDESWKEVQHWKGKDTTAAIGERKYIFDPNSGWREDQ